MFAQFFGRFNRKGRLTILCERITLRTIHNAAACDPAEFRSQFATLSQRPSKSATDDAWAIWMHKIAHPKRSMIIYLLISMGAAEFWKSLNKTEIYAAFNGGNPFRSTKSDVVVAESLVFLWNSFFSFVRHSIEEGKLDRANIKAVGDAGTTIGHVIQETTGWSIGEHFRIRTNEYDGHSPEETPMEVFARVLLRSIGKKNVSDPDRVLHPLGGLDDHAVVMKTLIHMTAWLPGYFKTYTNILDACPMD